MSSAEEHLEQNRSKMGVLDSMQINDTKAGMENIDKDKINSIILKHSQSRSVIN